jgi:hypothetical protein
MTATTPHQARLTTNRGDKPLKRGLSGHAEPIARENAD